MPALPCRQAAALKFAAAFARRSRHIAETLLLWWERYRQRRALNTLSEHMLNDMGLTRGDAGRESEKRFWEG
jgi:uncharacterized protein YjiS (DUF1127 family)